MLRDLHAELVQAGLRVLGVSPSDQDTHARFREEHKLPFQLVDDSDGVLASAFEIVGLFGFIRRTTYLIDRETHIADVVRADFRIGRHEDFVRRAIAAQAR